LIFTGGIPTFKDKTKTRQLVLLWVFPKIFSSCIGPMYLEINYIIWQQIVCSVMFKTYPIVFALMHIAQIMLLNSLWGYHAFSQILFGIQKKINSIKKIKIEIKGNMSKWMLPIFGQLHCNMCKIIICNKFAIHWKGKGCTEIFINFDFHWCQFYKITYKFSTWLVWD